jgi:hypothetical protein
MITMHTSRPYADGTQALTVEREGIRIARFYDPGADTCAIADAILVFACSNGPRHDIHWNRTHYDTFSAATKEWTEAIREFLPIVPTQAEVFEAMDRKPSGS